MDYRTTLFTPRGFLIVGGAVLLLLNAHYLGLALALVTVFIAFAVQHSRFGFGLFAIRDDERVADAIGVPGLRYKLAIFALNGVIAGTCLATAKLAPLIWVGGAFFSQLREGFDGDQRPVINIARE
jgi:ribose/xylose/arabinose/galactoside ABC-type transport system permease subunit